MKHATNPLQSEFTLCGDAFDIDAVCEDEAPIFAVPGEIVTCSQCRSVIDYGKSFKRYKEPAA